APALVGQTRTIPVTVRNFGAGVWSASGARAVALSYHVYDASGALLAWDGLRTALVSDVAPGASAVVDMAFAAPTRTGTYTVETDLVRDGVGWFSQGQARPGDFALRVTADLDAGYGPTDAPAAVVPGVEVPVQLHLRNTGLGRRRDRDASLRGADRRALLPAGHSRHAAGGQAVPRAPLVPIDRVRGPDDLQQRDDELGRRHASGQRRGPHRRLLHRRAER